MQKDSIEHFKTAFKDRYEASELIEYQCATDLFNRRQKESETVEDYITAMSDIAKSIDADAKL